MIKINQIDTIRLMNQQAVSPRSQIAKTLCISRNTVKMYANMEDFNIVLPIPKDQISILDPYKPIINKIIIVETKRWAKQRHTASRICTIIKESYGYTGGYTTVQKYVRETKKKLTMPESFNKLSWSSGEAQVDFGEADFIVSVKKTRKNFLL